MGNVAVALARSVSLALIILIIDDRWLAANKQQVRLKLMVSPMF